MFSVISLSGISVPLTVAATLDFASVLPHAANAKAHAAAIPNTSIVFPSFANFIVFSLRVVARRLRGAACYCGCCRSLSHSENMLPFGAQ